MGKIIAREAVSAKSQEAYAVVVDVGAFPNFMSNISACTVRSDEPGRKLVDWVMEIDGAELEWTEAIFYDDRACTAQFEAVEGIFSRFDGTWRVTDQADGALVELELEFELGLPEIEDIIGDILHRKLAENAEAMLQAIGRRAGAK